MKKQNLLKTAVAVLGIALLANPSQIRADDVNDLIGTILDASPKEKAKAAKYKTSKAKPSSSKTKSGIPDMRIPDSEVFEAAAKLPPDAIGKFVYGKVTLKTVSRKETGEWSIPLYAKNGRKFTLYTADPVVANAFSDGWGAQYLIHRECPLRIIAKGVMPGWYVVRLPFDNSTRNYTVQEELKGSTGEIQDAVKKFGDIFNQ